MIFIGYNSTWTGPILSKPVNMAKVECAFDASGYKVGLGEGPHWDVKNQRLFWLDILDRSGNNGKTLHIYDPIYGSVSRISP